MSARTERRGGPVARVVYDRGRRRVERRSGICSVFTKFVLCGLED